MGAKLAAVEGTLQRAETKGRANPRGLRDEGHGRLAPPPLRAVPAALEAASSVSDKGRDARAAVDAGGVNRDPSSWPPAVLAWLERWSVPAAEVVELGAGVLEGEKVRALGPEVGGAAGFRTDAGGWYIAHPASPAGLLLPTYAPGDTIPAGWAWRPPSPVPIGGERLKVLRTRASSGGGWWPFGLPVSSSSSAVVIVEGEKDWLALAGPARAAGLSVVGVPGADTWRAEWTGAVLRGRPAVIVALDNDDAGEAGAARILEAAREAGVPAVRQVPPPGKGKDWCDAIGAGVSRDEIVAGWAAAADFVGALGPATASLGPAVVLTVAAAVLEGARASEWPADIVRALGGTAAATDAWDTLGARYLSPELLGVLRSLPSAELEAAGFVRRGTGWMPLRLASSVGVALVPVYHPRKTGVIGWGAAAADGQEWRAGERWPIGLRWPADELLNRGPSSRPLVIVREMLDALALGGPAFGLPGDADADALDVVAVGDEWREEWAELLSGRPAVVLAWSPSCGALPWRVGAAAASAASAVGVPFRASGWRDEAGRRSWRDWPASVVVGVWRRCVEVCRGRSI
jgi:hypothetical protein